ncbi:MAG: GNAT family N-acetyltransferase, partial [Phototrophicaceae bacterium]
MLLPKLIGHLWRPLHPIDANALRHLIEECAFLDGFTAPARERTLEHIETDTLAAVDNTGKIAAFAWLERQSTAHEFRVILDGRVHPDYRGKGLGRFLLTWSEQRAQAIIAAQDAPAVTRIVFYDRDADAPRLYERFGFRFLFAEEEYRYAL